MEILIEIYEWKVEILFIKLVCMNPRRGWVWEKWNGDAVCSGDVCILAEKPTETITVRELDMKGYTVRYFVMENRRALH